jgi:TatD DNase family protein
MNRPKAGDYIDIHNHDSQSHEGVFTLDTLMAHEGRVPVTREGICYSAGIHPWFLTESNQMQLIDIISEIADNKDVIAIGEAGYDKLRGPSLSLQESVFEQQVRISEKYEKPLVIHCVRAWDELLASHKKMKPSMPWMIHGFRGKKELGKQLITRGMYLSFWFDFILRPESAELLKSLPPERIFLETDGSGVSIKDIYGKVAGDMGIGVDELKRIILVNFNKFFSSVEFTTDYTE